MDYDELRKEISVYLNILYECKYRFDVYKKLKLNNDVVNNYPYSFIVIINSLLSSCIVKLNSIISNDNNKTISKLLINCKQNEKYVNKEELSKIIENTELLLNSNSDIIKKIRIWRDKNMAHSDSKYFGKTCEMLKEHAIINEDILLFLNSLIECIEKLYKLFRCNGRYDYSIKLEEDLNNLLEKIK